MISRECRIIRNVILGGTFTMVWTMDAAHWIVMKLDLYPQKTHLRVGTKMSSTDINMVRF